jgi:hypothetical protein
MLKQLVNLFFKGGLEGATVGKEASPTSSVSRRFLSCAAIIS